MQYESTRTVPSTYSSGVSYVVWRMSFGRRLELMRTVRELARRIEYLEGGNTTGDKMEAACVRREIDRLFVIWGLKQIEGLELDGASATPETLIDKGPEELFREALAAVRAETGLSEDERKN